MNLWPMNLPVWVGFIVAVVTLIIVWGWRLSDLILKPVRYEVKTSPDELGLPCEKIQFNSSDKLLIKGFFIPARNAKGTIIVLHGYSTNKSDVIRHAEFLNRHGYNTLLFDFRAHGESKGKCTLGYLESRDLAGALNYLLKRTDVNLEKIGVFGLSMGANVAIITAAREKRIRAVVADSCFVSFKNTVFNWGCLVYNLPKFISIPGIWLAQLRALFWAENADAAKYIARISPRPVFIIGGAKDLRIPPENQEALFAVAGEPKQLWIVPETDHAEALSRQTKEYERKVVEFFEKYLG